MDKQTFLTAIQTERAELDSLLAQVDEARMTEPGIAGEWSVKDVIAHRILSSITMITSRICAPGWRKQNRLQRRLP